MYEGISLKEGAADQIKAGVPIDQVIESTVALKRSGKSLMGFCPFHNDKNKPSMSVTPEKGVYYCFSCGASGSVIDFVMGTRSISFTDAVLSLGQQYGIDVEAPQTEEERKAVREKATRAEMLYEIVALAQNFWQYCLNHEVHGKKATEYLRQRGVSRDIAQEFGLGYAPAGWSALYGYLVDKKKFPAALVEEAGLIVSRRKGDGYSDPFRDRLICPRRDVRGRVIAFGGRDLSGNSNSPKYINSPETPLFIKGHNLYALSQAKQAIADAGCAVICEGYMDVIALHQEGIKNVVAPLGTATSGDQIEQLRRVMAGQSTPKIVLCFDSDSAGISAAERCIKEAKGYCDGGGALHVFSVPDGKDPDEYVKKRGSGESFQKLIDTALNWIEWRIKTISARFDLGDIAQFSQASKEMIATIIGLSDEINRSHFIRIAAEALANGNTSPTIIEGHAQGITAQVNRQRRLVGRAKERQPEGLVLSDEAPIEIFENMLLRLCLFVERGVDIALEAMDTIGVMMHSQGSRELLRHILNHPCKEQGDLIDAVSEDVRHDPAMAATLARAITLKATDEIMLSRPHILAKQCAIAIAQETCQMRRDRLLEQLKSVFMGNGDCRHLNELLIAENKRLESLKGMRKTTWDDLVAQDRALHRMAE
jgi:DNA primase